MKKYTYLSALAGLAFTSIVHADPIGQWKSEPSDRGTDKGGYVVVEIHPCEEMADALCGTILKAIDGEGREGGSDYNGKLMLENLKPNGDSKWSGGTIWAPDEDKIYNSKIAELEDGTLKVYGCLFKGMLCRGQVWQRVAGS